MTDIMPFLFGFAGIVGILGSFVFGWIKGNPNNEARLRRMATGHNYGIVRNVGKGMTTHPRVIDLEGDSIAQVSKNKKIKLETRNKDGKPVFFLESGVPNILYNEEKATPLELDSEEVDIYFCSTCEREYNEEDIEGYLNDKKEPTCPYCPEHPVLKTEKVKLPVDPNAVGNSKEEQEHLFNIGVLLEGIEVAKVQAKFMKMLADIGLAKILLIVNTILLLALIAVLVTQGGSHPTQEAVQQAVKNATAGI